MASRDDIVIEITPQVLLKAYTCGIFPMAESAEDPALYWIEPQHRGILPLDKVHVPRRLARTLRTTHLQVRIDTDIDGVIEGCAASRPGRRSTWINERIRSLYRDLFDLGHCHTVEVWSGGRLVGGLYGVALNGAFFGESMFSYERDASKIALVYLAARLAHGGFRLLDTQFVTDHLRQFGTVELNREEFHRLLEKSLDVDADFKRLAPDASPDMILEILAAASAATRLAVACQPLTRALVGKLIERRVELLAVGRVLVDAVAGVPGGLEVGAELLYVAIDLGFSRGIRVVARFIHGGIHLAEDLELARVAANRLKGCNRGIGAVGRKRSERGQA